MTPPAADLDALLEAPTPRPTALVEAHVARVFPRSRLLFGGALAFIVGLALGAFASMLLVLPLVFVVGGARRGAPDSDALTWAALALWVLGTLAAFLAPFWKLTSWVRASRGLARRVLGEGVVHAGRVADLRVARGRARFEHARVELEVGGRPHRLTANATDAGVVEGASLRVLVAPGEPFAGVVLPTGEVTLATLVDDGGTPLDAPGPTR